MPTKLKTCLAILCAAVAFNTFAADYTVKPLVKELAETPTRVLFVGNSFMYYNCGVIGDLSGIAKAKGKKLVTTMVTISGAGLDWHMVDTYMRPNGLRSYSISGDGTNKLTFNKYPNGQAFEAVVLEDNSQGPIHPELSKHFEKYAALHCQDVRKAGAEPLIMMTWAYTGHPEMTQQLADATIKVANENKAMVAPVGLAFANSLKGKPDLRLLVDDNRHPTSAGTYLEACVFYAVLTKSSPEGADYLGGCEKPQTKENAAYLQKVAWDTCKEFFGWK